MMWGVAEVTKGYAGAAAAAVMCVKGKVPLTNHQNNNTLQQCILYYIQYTHIHIKAHTPRSPIRWAHEGVVSY